MVLFKKHLVPLILEGRKTQTRRLHKHQWKLGKTYQVKTNYYSRIEAHIRVTRKFNQRLGDISLEDVKKEGFNSLDDFKEAWRRINGNWTPDQTVIVYEFEIVDV